MLPQTAPPLAFSALTYNILARSLGSNCIPWVMTVNPETRARIEAATGMDWLDWRRDAVDREYTAHWHKNFDSGDYAAMRALWGAPAVASDDDVPASLSGCAFAREDAVTCGGEIYTTLRGCLRRSLGDAAGAALYAEVAKDEADVYAWPARGPRVLAAAAAADVVALQEYDVHDAPAAYDGVDTTFGDAMLRRGYDGVFFTDPLPGREPPSGLGVFWRRDVFAARDGVHGGGARLPCGEARGASLANHDLFETWHPCDRDGAEATLPAKDRRHCGVARLVHVASGRPVCVVAAHLMTTARDRAGVTRFPGEVRAGELATIRTLVEGLALDRDEAVLFLGDMNTAPTERATWRGDLDGRAPIATGFDDGRALAWAGRRLEDAFARDHGWADPAAVGRCTSRNGDRTQWIDYVFYDRDRLRPVERSDTAAPPRPIPDAVHPSDHLPLRCVFGWGAGDDA